MTRELIDIADTAVIDNQTMCERLQAVAARDPIGPVTMVPDDANHLRDVCGVPQRHRGSSRGHSDGTRRLADEGISDREPTAAGVQATHRSPVAEMDRRARDVDEVNPVVDGACQPVGQVDPGRHRFERKRGRVAIRQSGRAVRPGGDDLPVLRHPARCDVARPKRGGCGPSSNTVVSRFRSYSHNRGSVK